MNFFDYLQSGEYEMGFYDLYEFITSKDFSIIQEMIKELENKLVTK